MQSDFLLPLKRPCSCPRCTYDLAGEVARWNSEAADALPHASCPLSGTCPECGLAFAMRDVMRPGLVTPRWFFESAHSRIFTLLGTIISTWARSLLPWHFWERVRLEVPVNTRRVIIYGLLVLAGPWLVWFVTLGVLAMVHRYAFGIWAWGGPDGWLGAPRTSIAHDLLLPISALLRWKNWRETNPIPWLAIAPVLALAFPCMLMVLPATLRSSKVHRRHVLRASVYALAPFGVLGLIATLVPLIMCARIAFLELSVGAGASRGEFYANSFNAQGEFFPWVMDRYPMYVDTHWCSQPSAQYHYHWLLIAWFLLYWYLVLRIGWRMQDCDKVYAAIAIPALLACGIAFSITPGMLL